MASSGEGGDRRPPQNLQGLLKFCSEQTQNEDTTTNRPLEPLSDEKREFLENVLDNLRQSDPIKVMLEDIKVIVSTSGDTDEEKAEKEEALEDLQLHVEDLDLANDFHRIGGYSLLRPLLNDPHAGLRWRCADLIATLAQNNPYSQGALLHNGNVFETLVQMCESDSDDKARIKALYALSCLTREFPESQTVFIDKYDGFSVLIRAMQSNVDKLQTKASFMMAALCQENATYRATLLDMGLLDQLVSILHSPHTAFHEHVMRALLLLTDGNQHAQSECRRAELNLSKVLEQRIVELQGKEEYEEEMEYARKLQILCFHSNSGGDVER